ncbi:MAG: hypothetical protein DSZ29_00930 [Aquificaceae bacterium]|nr:MAG: hypothetical protein DSZ29_00930 [Aquificaceae bacterium]
MGMRNTLPLVIAATPFAIVFGALAISNGLSAWLVMAMSVFVFSGASQFIAITLLASATFFPIITRHLFLTIIVGLLSFALMQQFLVF